MDADEAEKTKAQKVRRWLYWIMAVFILAPLAAAYLLGSAGFISTAP